jgi:hypothetical protein
MVKMDQMNQDGFRKIFALTCGVLLVFNFFIYPVLADEPFSIVSVLSDQSEVSGSETFTVSIFCDPVQSIKAFELSVSFDETLLQANSVSEGTIFDGFETFYNSGTINNTTGTITNVYSLILGAGNVSESGSLVTISFTALGVSGTAHITLTDAGLTNETMYLPVSVINGSVQIDATAPLIADNSMAVGTTGDEYTFNVSVTDNLDESMDILTKVDWSHGGNSGNLSMDHVGGSYFEKTVSLDDSISEMTYTIYAQDSSGNSLTTDPSSVTVTDNDDPSIESDTSIAVGTTADAYTWFVNVSDNVDAEEDLTVKIDWSHGSLSENASMVYDSSFWTYSHLLDDSISEMTYSIYVEDQSGNSIMVSGYQSPVSVTDNDDPVINTVQATPASQVKDEMVNLSATITDNIEISDVFVNVSYPDASTQNHSIVSNQSLDTFYSLESYSTLGSYSFFFYAIDTSGNAVVSSLETFTIVDVSSPSIGEVFVVSSTPSDTLAPFGWVNFSVSISDDDLDSVQLNYTDRHDVATNVSMIHLAGDLFYYNTTLSTYGNYSYYIWSDDSSGNSNKTTIQSYSMPPNWDINKDGVCDMLDLVAISEKYGETGPPGWIREDVNNDGEIRVMDIVLLSNHYEEGWW